MSIIDCFHFSNDYFQIINNKSTHQEDIMAAELLSISLQSLAVSLGFLDPVDKTIDGITSYNLILKELQKM